MTEPLIYDFSKPENNAQLADYIGAKDECNLLMEASLPENRYRFYQQHKIPKLGKNSKNKYRLVWEIINNDLLQVSKNFAANFGKFVYSKKYIHKSALGYVSKKGIRDNAEVHSGASLLLRADLANFFPSISSAMLIKRFKKLELNDNIIKTLIGFLTIDECLPLGFPSSPMLANIVCKELDEKISDLALKYECKYTRYADDISISGNTMLPTKEELAEIIYKENFRLCDSKFRITKIGQAHYVTGLSISDNKMPHAPRNLKRKLRQELHYCKKFGIKNHLKKIIYDNLDISKVTLEYDILKLVQKNINRIDGMICYVSHIEKKPCLLKEWRDLLARDKCTITYISHKKDQKSEEIVFYIDETTIKKNANEYLAIAFTAIDGTKVNEIAEQIKKILYDYINNPHTGSDKSKLEKEKLHFVTADHQLKDQGIEYISKKNLKTYIAYGLLNNSTYLDTYINLIKKIMPRLLSKGIYDGTNVTFNFEENSKVPLNKIEKTLIELDNQLSSNNSKKPNINKINFVTKKNEYCLTAPDFMLGVLNKYIDKGDEKNSFENRMFEKLRAMYTMILNIDTNNRFTRKHPFCRESF